MESTVEKQILKTTKIVWIYLRRYFSSQYLYNLECEGYILSYMTLSCIYGHTDVLEQKPDGLISVLDEVSNFPKATDITLATKLKQQLNSNPCFKGERGGTFSVRHYAGEVSFLLQLCLYGISTLAATELQ